MHAHTITKIAAIPSFDSLSVHCSSLPAVIGVFEPLLSALSLCL